MFILQLNGQAINNLQGPVGSSFETINQFRSIMKQIRADPSKAAELVNSHQQVFNGMIDAMSSYTGIKKEVVSAVMSEFQKAICSPYGAYYVKDAKGFVLDSLPAEQIPLFNQISQDFQKNLAPIMASRLGKNPERLVSFLAYVTVKQADFLGLLEVDPSKQGQVRVGPAKYTEVVTDVVKRTANFFQTMLENKDKFSMHKIDASIDQPLPVNVLAFITESAGRSKKDSDTQFAANYGANASKVLEETVRTTYAYVQAYREILMAGSVSMPLARATFLGKPKSAQTIDTEQRQFAKSQESTRTAREDALDKGRKARKNQDEGNFA